MIKIILLGFALSLVSCSTVKSLRLTNELVIATTTDFHASLDRAEGLANALAALREKYSDQLLYLDAGDLFQGSLEGDLAKGKAIVALFNSLGLDAAALGNHDLDYGPRSLARIIPRPGEDPVGALKQRAAEARFPWLSANWVAQKSSGHKNALGQPTVLRPHAVFNRQSMKVCVIGVTTPSTAHKTIPEFIRGTRFEPLKPIVEAEAKFLRHTEKCTFVLLLAHAGLGGDSEIKDLAEKLPPGTLDAIVAGHTHELAQATINGIPVIQAGAKGRAVGVLHLFAAGRPPQFDPFLTVGDKEKNADATDLLKPYRAQAEKLRSEKLGMATKALTNSPDAENALGNLVADAVLAAGKRAHPGVQFALVHGSHLRADLPQGEIKYGDIYKILPFSNSLAVVEMTGTQLRRFVEVAASGAHGLAPVSGMKVQLLAAPVPRDLNGDGKQEAWELGKISEIFDAKGKPLLATRMYTVATIDYLTYGGDHQEPLFKELAPARVHRSFSLLTRDMVSDFIRRKKKIVPEVYFSDGLRRFGP